MKTRERREEEEEPAGVPGMVTRKAFGSFRRRLNGERRLKERHGEKILACCYISPVVHKPIHMKNET